MATSRGIRNNNPGNIDRNPANQWQGRMPRDRMTAAQLAEPRFEVFQAPAWGIRAMCILLINYQDKHGLNTISGIIGRWAPTVENNTSAYVLAVARAVGVGADAWIDVQQYRYLRPLVEAIIQHENGSQPYAADVIDEGLRLAGVVKPVDSTAMATPAATATVTALYAGGSAAVIEGIQQALPLLQAAGSVSTSAAVFPGWLRVVAGVLVLCSVGASVYAWWRLQRAARAVQG